MVIINCKWAGGIFSRDLFKLVEKWGLNLRGFEKNKGVDQPAHPHRLISAFVFNY